MPYRVNCPSCKTAYIVPEDSLGKRLQCSKCRQPFAVGNPKPPAPAAPKPAAAGRATANPAPRPASEPRPRRNAVQPQIASPAPAEQRKKSRLPIIGALAGLLLILSGAIVAGIYFLKSRPEAPIAQDVRQPVNAGATLSSKTPVPLAPDQTQKPELSQQSALPAPIPTSPVAFNPSSSPTPSMPATAPIHADPTRIKIPNPRLAKYEPESKRWVYSFRNAVRATNGIFYIDLLPPGAPTDRESYATKLLQKDFQEPGQQFSEIGEKGDLPDGFFLKGAMKKQDRPKPEFGFVIVRKINGAFLRCRNGVVANRPVSDEELRQTMLDIFKQVTIRTTTLVPLPPPSGAAMLRDNATLVIAQAETANLIYYDTMVEREIKRVEVDFQPGEVVVQGDTIFAAVKGSALIYALDAATGKVKKEHNLGGDGIVHLACHPHKGLIYASTTKFGIVSLDPVSGVVQKSKAMGQFLAVSPDGRFLYTGVQPPHRDEMEIISRKDGSIDIYWDMWGPRAILSKYAVEGPDLRFLSGQNNAAVNGWWMHLTPDGKRLMMVGGGGWRPPKEGGTGGGYITAIFSADNLATKLQPIPFSGLNTIFHPVLNLGVTNNYGLNATLFNGKSLVKRTEFNLSPEREARPLLLMFGGKGRKLILWNGNNIQKEQGLHFLPLPLKPEEEVALAQAAQRPAAPPEPMSEESSGTRPQSSPAATEAQTTKSLPPDLDLVPEKETVFLSVLPADLWKNPSLAPLRKLAQTNGTIVAGFARLKQGSGLEPSDIQRAVIVFWGKQANPNSVVFTTTVRPFDRSHILGMIGEGQQEETVSGKTVISSPKSEFALHLLNERTFLYGRAAEVKKLLERPAGAARNASWNAILRSSPRHPLQIGALHDIFPPDLKKQMPPALNGLNPLLDAQLAVATLDAGKDLRLSVRLMFNDAEQVKQGEKAARQGLNLATVFLNQFAAPFKKNAPGSLPPPFAKLIAGVDGAEAALKKTTIQIKNNVISCDVVLASDTWPEALAGGLELFLASPNQLGPSSNPKRPGPPPNSKKPEPSRVKEPKSAEEAEAAIKKLGGNVQHEGFDDKKPLVEVRFTDVRLTDNDLIVLSKLVSLKKLKLAYSEEITDEGVKHLRRLVNLEELSIYKNRLTDDSLAEIKKFKKLDTLILGYNQITDKGLVHLKELSDLAYLDLSANMGITDAGLEHLKVLKNLRELHLFTTQVSDKGVASLKQALPDLKIRK